MILVPKQALIPAYPQMSHRRQFSAPAPSVVVQPTRTPGLLSLSKPPRTALQQRSLNQQQQHQQQQHRQSRTSKAKQHALTASRLSDIATTTTTTTCLPLSNSVLVNAPATVKDTVFLNGQQAAPSPEKVFRGRSHGKTPKEKTPRRITPNSSPRPHLRRQPSPPTDALSDPFLVSDSEASDSKPNMSILPVRPTPSIASRPNGNLATRRRQQEPASPSPTPAKAVPVPGATLSNGTRPTLARSEPIRSHMPARPAPRRSNTAALREFPVCDDNVAQRLPATPARNRSWKQSTQVDDGPRTAPLAGFPFDISPSQRLRRHARTPSDGVFDMSLDEDDVSANPADMEALLKMLRRTPGRGGSFDASALARENKEKERARLFASSMFQNSPSPDELPPPCF